MISVTQSRLKEVLHYDPQTGAFTWLTDTARHSIGDIAVNKDHRGEISISIDGESTAAHRWAFLYMEGELPPDCVDHINRKPDDNRWSNLRHATRAQNAWNRVPWRLPSSGYMGVKWDNKRRKWRAKITHNNITYVLGFYKTAVLAAEKYNDFVTINRGEFGYLNKIKKEGE